MIIKLDPVGLVATLIAFFIIYYRVFPEDAIKAMFAVFAMFIIQFKMTNGGIVVYEG